LRGTLKPILHGRRYATDASLNEPKCLEQPTRLDLAKKEMPEKLMLCGTGTSFTFTA
jgi:hypothetical protein